MAALRTATETTSTSGPCQHTEHPESVHKDAREAARVLLSALLTGSDWPGLIRRSDAETKLPNPLTTPQQIDALLSLVSLEGSTKPFLPVPFRISEIMMGAHQTLAVLANLVGLQRGLEPQRAVVNTEHATISCSGHFLVNMNGTIFKNLWKESMKADLPNGAFNTGIFYQLWSQHFVCKDGRAIFLYQKWDPPADLLRMIGFPESEIPSLIAMTDPKTSSTATRSAFQRRLADHIAATWNSFDLEAHIIKTRIGAAVVPLSRKEFLASPQGQAVGWRPPLEFHRVDSPSWKPVPFGYLKDPARGLLSGIKVVELTRALMGSRIGAILAYMGATVVKATSPFMADYGLMSAAHNAGKLSVFLDLSKEADKAQLRELVMDADCFISNYALGALDRLGFGFKQVCKMIEGRDRGIVFVEGNAFGHHGPRAHAPGFEHLAQALSGLAWAQGINHGWNPEPEGGHMPATVPINFIDKGSGHIGAIGAITALLRRSSEGGSFHVQMSLVQTANFLLEFGLYPGLDPNEPSSRDERHWLHSSVWPKYVKEELWPDPDGFTFYIGYILTEYMDKAHPALLDDKFFDYYLRGPFGNVKILKPPLSVKSFEKTPMRYRIPPRPIGFDEGITSFEVAEKRIEELAEKMERIDYVEAVSKGKL